MKMTFLPLNASIFLSVLLVQTPHPRQVRLKYSFPPPRHSQLLQSKAHGLSGGREGMLKLHIDQHMNNAVSLSH